ncbi:PREDICTED: uncharacterized protein LOC105108592 isoform X5 [Populus euphratica]|uniref:Uncharacterized protein LOC105108592 isoform X5 n=1 Tax=Populus euphratica TaxID=75702 RepID=A0AAJ6X0W0_POPEU|nr:PREDICTED: uncharacterized protein LOC105108592 isoform X5 [Populus euphratica]
MENITVRCIGQMGRTLQDVISDWIGKLNNREIGRTRMPLNLAEMITVGTHVCNDCHGKLISFLLYWFWISMPKYVRTVGFKQYRSLSKQVVRFMFFNV